MAMTLTNLDPAADEQDVALDKTLQLLISEDTYDVVDASVLVRLRISPSQTILVYSGASGGFQSGYQGAGSTYSNVSGTGVAITIDPESNLYETFPYEIEVEADNTNSDHLSDSYAFGTALVGVLRNSGFEAPGASAGLALDWSFTGWDKDAQLGIKRGRLGNPVIMPPPEGDYVHGMGSTDLNEALDAAASQISPQTIGTGTAGVSDAFGAFLTLPENHFIVPGSVEVRRNSEKVAVDDETGGIIGNTPSHGLVAYYKLNDDAADTVVEETTGSGAPDGVLNGGKNTEDVSVASDYAGLNKAFNLATADAVVIPSHPNIHPTGPFTVCFFFKGVPEGSYPPVLWCLDSGAHLGFGIQQRSSGNRLNFIFGDGSAWAYVEPTTVVLDNTIHHVAVQYDGTYGRAFINGVEVGTPAAVALSVADVSMSICSARAGVVDDLRVYDYALTSTTIATIANARVEAPSPYPDPVEDVSGYFDFWSGYIYVQENGRQVWEAGDAVNVVCDTMPLSFSHVLSQYIMDRAIDYDFLTGRYKWAAPAGFSSGLSWKLRVLIDGAVIWSKDLAAGDEDTSEEGIFSIDTSGYSGTGHTIKFLLTMSAGASISALFDNETKVFDEFDLWDSSREVDFYIEGAVAALFDDNTAAYEGFETATDAHEEDFDADTAVSAEFDSDTATKEEFENWD